MTSSSMRTCGRAVGVALSGVLLFSTHVEAGANPYAAVRVLYLVPPDRPIRSDYIAAIEHAAGPARMVRRATRRTDIFDLQAHASDG
jgi:hypothetical protein